MHYQLPYFHPFNLHQIGEYYKTEITHHGQQVSIDLNFEGTQASSQLFDVIKVMLENIGQQDLHNRSYLSKELEESTKNTVRDFLTFHTEELADSLFEYVQFDHPSTSPEEQLMHKLKLDRIGFYPDGKYGSESFVVFDYLVDKKLSDELLVMNYNQQGKLLYISWES